MPPDYCHGGIKRKKNVDGGGGGEWGSGGNTETETVCQTVKGGKIQNNNHLHNVQHVVQSTLQNM